MNKATVNAKNTAIVRIESIIALISLIVPPFLVHSSSKLVLLLSSFISFISILAKYLYSGLNINPYIIPSIIIGIMFFVNETNINVIANYKNTIKYIFL